MMAANSARQPGSVAVLILLVMASCAAPTAGSSPADVPPAGAVTANAAYPPVGAKWQVRVTDNVTGSVRETTVAAVTVDFDGNPAYGLSSVLGTQVLNPTTFNSIAHMKGNKVTDTSLPDSGRYQWPLWVGKSWTSTFSYNDAERGFHVAPVVQYNKVSAYEDISVPAGTFKAFRINTTPGMNDAVNITTWYAPDIKIVVKSIFQQTSGNYLGTGQTTTELLTLPK